METINHECYVSLEVAELLKKAGFDWRCFAHYHNGILDSFYNIKDNYNSKHYEDGGYNVFYSAPTLEVAQRWLREVEDIHVNAHLVYEPIENENRWTTKWHLSYCALPYDADDLPDDEELISHYFNTYEEALEAGIKKALELILEKGE